MSEKHVIEIKKQPFYMWILLVIWLVGLVAIFQNAWTSGLELESRAAGIFWVTFVVWLLGGIVIWFTRRGK
jgi:hypothetical protein